MAKQERGFLAESVTMDNGSEFSDRVSEVWAIAKSAQLYFILPGCPVENSFIESFDGRLLDKCLKIEWFSSMREAREKLTKVREHYNHKCSHSALTDRVPPVPAARRRPERRASPGYGQGKRLTSRPFPCNPIPLARQRRGAETLAHWCSLEPARKPQEVRRIRFQPHKLSSFGCDRKGEQFNRAGVV